VFSALRGAFPQLQSARLTLRQIVASDAQSVFTHFGDAAAMPLFGSAPLTTLVQAHALVASFDAARYWPSPGIRFGICWQGANPRSLIGTCGLFKLHQGSASARIGYDLVRSARGQGVAFEAASALITWGFDALKLRRIEAQVHPQNFNSLRLAYRLGFVREALARDAGQCDGRYHDLLVLGLLKGAKSHTE
jgi:[ribosomal protein S5]-alanine N-acetyltransferase